MTESSDIRDAATVLLVRDAASDPAILMGQRGASAAFMPSKFVFPGGAVDGSDAGVPLARAIGPSCRSRLLRDQTRPVLPENLAAAAIRELWEETGLRLAVPGHWPGEAPADWAGFAENGLVPDAGALSFVFRAVTPPGRPRRFDARFFVAGADGLADDPEDFSRASDELSHLQWIPVQRAVEFDLPFVTRIVLAELADRLPDLSPPAWVPFFDNRTAKGRMVQL